MHDNERLRLSLEGSQLIKPKNNYIKIDQRTLKSYLAGENLFINEINEVNNNSSPFLIVIYENTNLGCVNIKNDKILNYMPKSRRLCFNKVF